MVIKISKIIVCRVGEMKHSTPLNCEEFKQKIVSSSGYVNQGVIHEHNNHKYFIMLLYDDRGEYGDSSSFNPHRVGIASNDIKLYYDDTVFFSEEVGSVCK